MQFPDPAEAVQDTYALEPQYRESGDLLVVGVKHSAFEKELRASKSRAQTKEIKERIKRAQKEFASKIKSANHLAIEGSPIHEEMQFMMGDGYERLALQVARCSPTWLEDEPGYAEILRKYGVNPEMLAYKAILGIVEKIDFNGKGPLAQMCLDDYLRSSVETFWSLFSRYDRSLQQVDPQELIRRINLFRRASGLNSDEDALKNLDMDARIFNHYFARIREVEVLAPRIRDLKTNHEGRKIAIVGAAHLDYIVKFLETGVPKELLKWQDFIGLCQDEDVTGILKVTSHVLNTGELPRSLN